MCGFVEDWMNRSSATMQVGHGLGGRKRAMLVQVMLAMLMCWLSRHNKKQPLGLCIPSKPPKNEDSENMLWDVLENIGAQRPVMWVVGCLPVE